MWIGFEVATVIVWVFLGQVFLPEVFLPYLKLKFLYHLLYTVKSSSIYFPDNVTIILTITIIGYFLIIIWPRLWFDK